MILRERVDADKEDGFEFEPLDVLDIEHSHGVLAPSDLAIRTRDHADIVRDKSITERIRHRANISFAVYKDRNGRQFSNELFDFENSLSQPCRSL